MQRQITIKLLQSFNACNEGIGYFKNTFQDGVTIEEMIDKKCKYQLWLFYTFKLTGAARDWYKNGQLRCEYNFKNGKAKGIFRDWYENGQPMYEYNYKNGKKEGISRDWYSDGQLEYERNYKNGKII